MGAVDQVIASHPNAMGVYAIRNLVTGKIYIGSAVNFRRRFNAHRLRLRNGDHHSIRLQSSWNKHGESAFAFEVLEIVEDRGLLLESEQRWLDAHVPHGANGYNVLPRAGSRLGVRNTPEAIEKTASALRGRKRPRELVERLAAMKRGTKHSEETKEKCRAAHAGVPLSESHAASISAALKGRIFSDKHRAKISAANKGNTYGLGNRSSLGRKQSPEEIAKRAASNRGQKRTQEQIERMAAPNRGRKHTAEARANMSVAHIGQKPWNKGIRSAI